jgi:hypothetical protein
VRTPFAVIALLLAVLVPLALATSEDEPAPPKEASVATIAERVQELRGLRYDRLPRPARVTPSEAVKDGLADLDRGYPPAARHADEALYERLGMLPAGTDLRELSGSIFGQGVAGYYDPRSKRLKIVTGTATANRVLAETVIAHELTHALEDQAVGLDLEAAEATDDRGYAYKALVEGTATEVMFDYLNRHFRADVALGGLLGSTFAGTGTEGLPPFVTAGLLFPYTAGQRFVADLVRRAGGDWTLVDLAERTRPPTTTEQILHPQKWIDAEAALPVALPSPGPGWRRVTDGTFGEWQTGQLLGSPGAAQGWGGDRYALYRREGRDLVVMRWRFDTPAALQAFTAALREADLPGPRTVRARGGRVTLVLPSTA